MIAIFDSSIQSVWTGQNKVEERAIEIDWIKASVLFLNGLSTAWRKLPYSNLAQKTVEMVSPYCMYTSSSSLVSQETTITARLQRPDGSSSA